MRCIPGFSDGEDCLSPPQNQTFEPFPNYRDESGPGSEYDRGDTAVLLHGLAAVANVAVPVLLRFMVVNYQLLPSLSQYSSDYFGICGIIYWISW